MKWLKLIAGITALSAAGAAVAAKTAKDKKRQAELDEFLVPDEENPIVLDIPAKNAESIKKMKKDIASFEQTEILPVILTFEFEEFKEAQDLQDVLSENNISSTLHDENRKLEVSYHGNVSPSALESFANLLEENLKSTSIEYQGFSFND